MCKDAEVKACTSRFRYLLFATYYLLLLLLPSTSTPTFYYYLKFLIFPRK